MTRNGTRSVADNLSICPFPSITEPAGPITFAFLINGPILFVVVVIGFFGNLLCLTAFSRSRRPRQINYYLTALSLWDFSLVTGSFFLYNLPYLLYGRIVTQGTYVLAYPLIYAVTCAAHSGSIIAVITSGADRYFALCHPLTHKVYSSARRTALILCVEAVLILLYNTPRYYELQTSYCLDRTYGFVVPFVHPSQLRSSPAYYLCYKVIGGMVFFSLGPLMTLIFLSVKVWIAVSQLTRTEMPIGNRTSLFCPGQIRANRRGGVPLRTPIEGALTPVTTLMSAPTTRRILRRHSTASAIGQESQYALNTMLLTVIVKFVICHSLPTALDVCEAIMPSRQFNSALIGNFVAVSNFLVVCNSSVNFFIYSACSRRFRNDLALFRKKNLQRPRAKSNCNNGLAKLSDSNIFKSKMTSSPSRGSLAAAGSINCRRGTVAVL